MIYQPTFYANKAKFDDEKLKPEINQLWTDKPTIYQHVELDTDGVTVKKTTPYITYDYKE